MFARTLPIPACLSLFSALAAAQQSAARIDAPLLVGDRQTRFQKLGDIDGDGYVDAFSGWWNSTAHDYITISAWKNDQHGKLEKTWSRFSAVYPVDSGFWAFATGDIDGNGTCDVVFGAGQKVSPYFTAPGGGPEQYTSFWYSTGGPAIRGLALVDTDQDGVREIAVVHGDLTILRFTSTPGGGLNPIDNLALGAVNGEVMAVDINDDNIRDLFVWDATRVMLVPLVGGLMQSPTIFSHTRTDPRGNAGDLDGDGDEDLVVFDAGTYELFRRTGTTSWSHEGPFVGGPARYLYDIDHDGDLDGVCCGGGGGPYAEFNAAPGIFRIALNDGSGHFAPAIEFPGLGSERLAGAADLDHDGDLDLVAGRCVYYAPSNFAYGLPRQTGVGSARPEQFADIDGDGDLDLQPGTTPLVDDGNALFSAASSILPAPPANSEFEGQGYAGDFDGDGDCDLVVSLRTNGVFQNMQLLRNCGGGSFVDGGPAGAAGVQFSYASTGPQPEQALVSDADGDGDLDLVVRALPAQTKTRIFWNDGQGFFSAGPSWPDVLVRNVVDLTQDGIPDLVGWYRFQSWNTDCDLYSFAGQGSGTFPTYGQVLDMQTSDPWGAVFGVGDADGDGDLDIVGGSGYGVALLVNPGTAGGWSVATTIQADQYSSNEGTHGANFVDLDGDGKLDVLGWPVGYYTEYAPTGAHVLLRKPDNTGYVAQPKQIVKPSAVLDLDGDGDDDLIAGAVYKSRRFEAPDGGMRQQVGAGVAGTGGIAPRLGARGPFRFGQTGQLLLTGAVGGASGWMFTTFVAQSQPVFTGGVQCAVDELYIAPTPISTNGAPGYAGVGCWSQSFSPQPEFIGRTVRYRAVLSDQGAPRGKSVSNELFLTFGP